MISVFDLDLSWQDAGACRTANPDLFFGRDGGHFTAGKAICATCPAIDPCRQHGLLHEVDGLWGGLTPAERKAERIRLGIVLERIIIDYGFEEKPGRVPRKDLLGGRTHGLRSTYVDGCSCRPCRAAEAAYSRTRYPHRRRPAHLRLVAAS